MMTRLLLSTACGFLLCAALTTAQEATPAPVAAEPKAKPPPASEPGRDLDLVIVVGAEGAAEYGAKFIAQAQAWQEAGRKARAASVHVVGLTSTPDAAKDGTAAAPLDDLATLQRTLEPLIAKKDGALWLVLIGHGTFDGRETKFNLRGPDLAAKSLGGLLQPLKRELVFINLAPASAGFLPPLAGANRVIVSATKSPDEIYHTRFGDFFTPALTGDLTADLDRDHQVSVLEAFLHACKRTAEYYENEGRIATEHAVLDDNGDGAATRSELFEGLRAKPPQEGAQVDGARAAQLALVLSPVEARMEERQRSARDSLERKLDALKDKRGKMAEDAWYTELEKLLRELAEVYR